MIFTVGELAEQLDSYGDDRPVRWSDDPQGGPTSARLLDITLERWPNEVTGKIDETVVIYPV
jgi:hypothetical protein